MGATLSQGLGDHFGGISVNDPLASRKNVGNRASKINFNIRESILMAARLSLHLRLSGQLSDKPLLISDQFAIGGSDSVRGFTQGEAVGDNGIIAGGEFRTSLDQQGRVFVAVFVDQGISSLHNAEQGQPSHTALTSAGLGFRVTLVQYLHGRIDFGIPVSSSQNADNESSVVYAQLVSQF
jgi:hemolysin activation/secretion protein